jgi:hypothetical protein
MTGYELQSVLKAYVTLLEGENPFELNLFKPSITVKEATEMMELLPKVREYLAKNKVRKPMTSS